MKRDITVFQMDGKEVLVACDNTGGVGLLSYDEVCCTPDLTGALTARVALFELLCAGGKPEALALASFLPPLHTQEAVEGVKAFLDEELGMELPWTMSSEKNFTMKQSAFSCTAIGIRTRSFEETVGEEDVLITVGQPLCGEEVLLGQPEMIAGAELLYLLSRDFVKFVVPCGSGGVEKELLNLGLTAVEAAVDVKKSAGPASCAICCLKKEGLEEAVRVLGKKAAVLSVKPV